jgi:hypothetical protein
MPKKPNYNFEKRQKDLARQKKKEEKLQKKALKKAGGDGEAEPGTGAEVDAGPPESTPAHEE